MYELIDELIIEIKKGEEYRRFLKASQALNEDDIRPLLMYHQQVQDDYLQLKQYQNFTSIQETKEKLKSIKEEMSQKPQVIEYYQAYHELNDLLEEVTKMIFHDISDDIYVGTYQL